MMEYQVGTAHKHTQWLVCNTIAEQEVPFLAAQRCQMSMSMFACMHHLEARTL